jgi:hypothetical protein
MDQRAGHLRFQGWRSMHQVALRQRREVEQVVTQGRESGEDDREPDSARDASVRGLSMAEVRDPPV